VTIIETFNNPIGWKQAKGHLFQFAAAFFAVKLLD